MKLRFRIWLIAIFAAGLISAQAIQIVVDLSHDTDGLFGSIPGATATLNAAAADLSSYLTSPLLAIPSDSITGSSGSTDVTFTISYNYSNPFTDESLPFSPSSLAIGEYRIFTGLRDLSGSTLGQGGPGGVSLGIGASGSANEFPAATANAESAANTAFGRGGGPTLATFEGDLTLGSATATYSLTLGAGIGNLWFDQNSSATTSPSFVSDFLDLWHVDHTTPVAAGKFDLYTVALHEMMHAIGYGTMRSWDDLVSNGTNWLGTNVIQLLGTGMGVLDSDSAHSADGLLTLNTQGVQQEAVMVTALPSGTRRTLTELDLAFLSDMGWDVVAIPEPHTIILLLMAVAVFGWHIRRLRQS